MASNTHLLGIFNHYCTYILGSIGHKKAALWTTNEICSDHFPITFRMLGNPSKMRGQ
jgi:hypothetical protein